MKGSMILSWLKVQRSWCCTERMLTYAWKMEMIICGYSRSEKGFIIGGNKTDITYEYECLIRLGSFTTASIAYNFHHLNPQSITGN